MKHYFVTITEVDGEYEFTTSFLSRTDTDVDNHFEQLWKNFRGGEVDDNGDLWSGSIIVKTPNFELITKEEFDVMKKYLTVV